jgi:1-deoxy-D-xylulose-5-phosphate reductoisomerase
MQICALHHSRVQLGLVGGLICRRMRWKRFIHNTCKMLSRLCLNERRALHHEFDMNPTPLNASHTKPNLPEPAPERSPQPRQRVCILGSTGSIGVSTLDVMARHPDRFEVFAVTAHSRADELLQQCLRWQPRFAALFDMAQANDLRARLKTHGLRTQVLAGPAALCELAAHPEVDAVMAAIVGAAGLAPCLAAANAGKRLLLANKEALVVGAALFMKTVREGSATLLPIDSEHSAIFQCLPENPRFWPEHIDHIVLTASGGPFRSRDAATLKWVTPDEACTHPNWVMGRKISVDSATMMNKALEVIEARWLFDLKPEQIRVVIHPQSIIHSMVVCRDNSVLAQLGTPDMRVPIAYGLSFPRRIESGASQLDFATLSNLSFEPPDEKRYPSLALAWATLRGPEGSTAVLNAANEVAVAAFLAGSIRFDQIHSVNAQALEQVNLSGHRADTLASLLELDARVRLDAAQFVKRLG